MKTSPEQKPDAPPQLTEEAVEHSEDQSLAEGDQHTASSVETPRELLRNFLNPISPDEEVILW